VFSVEKLLINDLTNGQPTHHFITSAGNITDIVLTMRISWSKLAGRFRRGITKRVSCTSNRAADRYDVRLAQLVPVFRGVCRYLFWQP